MNFNGGYKPWGKGALSWKELNSLLSGEPNPQSTNPEAWTNLAEEPAPKQPVKLHGHGVELHIRSSFSFLLGASDPEDFVDIAAAKGLDYIGIMDRDGLYSAVVYAGAAKEAGMGTCFGAELTLADGKNKSEGCSIEVLSILARDPEGYRLLSRVIAKAAMDAGEKGLRAYPSLEELAAIGRGHWYVLADNAEDLEVLCAAFGPEHVIAELVLQFVPGEQEKHESLIQAATNHGLRIITSCQPVAATKADCDRALVKAALRTNTTINDIDPSVHPMGGMWLTDHQELLAHYAEYADYLVETESLAAECAFDLDLIKPGLPVIAEPETLDRIVAKRQAMRYRGRPKAILRKAAKQLRHELDVIHRLGFPGYFLIVADIVDFCHKNNIYCQGRGSAANSAVCFALGITNVEPLSNGLLFERFLSEERDDYPDIDLDIESGRRPEVIAYVYETYGRDCAAQVANLITYRTRGSIRDASRALGLGEPPKEPENNDKLMYIAGLLKGQPRHLGIHSAGMVIADRPIADIVPTEWARMEGRSVVQWDKESCAEAGLVKFDLLGLGMLEALHYMVDLAKEHRGEDIRMWELTCDDPAVYSMISSGDAVGLFQIESRAQMSMLPRLKPSCFFDLVVEVAIIRPGPIQGGSVHPYIRRRDGLEPVTYDHPCLEPILEKTLGIPLFQEQLMNMAVVAAGFSGAEADQLRRAMGANRSFKRMDNMRRRFYAGLEKTNGITGDTADRLWNKMLAFAAYGFPESHSQSFAFLVYFSAWFKRYYPAEFYVGLLRAQPMGFYSPQSLLADARRHRVPIHPIDLHTSIEKAQVELSYGQNGEPQYGIRLGFDLVKGLSSAAAERIVAAREQGKFKDLPDLARRAELTQRELEALSAAGILEAVNLSRRQAMWESRQAALHSPDTLELDMAPATPSLPGMNPFELMLADIATTGVTADKQPMEFFREQLHADGILSVAELDKVQTGTRVRIAGIVTHKQRPMTAGGTTFFSVEDETGIANVVISQGLWLHQKKLLNTAQALVIRGVVRNNGAISITADHCELLRAAHYLNPGSRDFR
ncbi:MAG: PHP domain-containing protein [Corynebacterium sp.]|nr:PHP domain-containing protein [Corynebacterium sp.]